MKAFFNSQSDMALFGFDQSLSFPTAGQGNDDSGNEIVVLVVPLLLKQYFFLNLKAGTILTIAIELACLLFFVIFQWNRLFVVAWRLFKKNSTNFLSSPRRLGWSSTNPRRGQESLHHLWLLSHSSRNLQTVSANCNSSFRLDVPCEQLVSATLPERETTASNREFLWVSRCPAPRTNKLNVSLLWFPAK